VPYGVWGWKDIPLQFTFTGWFAVQGVEVEDRAEASEEDKVAAAKSGEEIYIGFDKSDGAPRKGRKGRVLNDDPSRYILLLPRTLHALGNQYLNTVLRST